MENAGTNDKEDYQFLIQMVKKLKLLPPSLEKPD